MSCSRGLSSHRCFLPLNVGSSLWKTPRVLVRSGAGPAFHNTPLGSSVLREEGGDMFAKLITLLLQSKAAALTGVFVIGTTGALVSATTQNGVTTVTITQTSPTTVVESPSPVASLNSNLMPVSSPTTLTPSATPCSDQAHARADAVRRVNGEFNKDHQGLGQLARVNRTAKDLEILRTADVLIKGIRPAAVKAIHATNTCEDNDKDEDAADKAQAKNDDEDTDEHEDEGEVHAATSDEHHTTARITFSGTDPKAIADEAVAAMKLAFETAKNSVTNQVTTPTSPRKPEPKHGGDRARHDDKGHH